MEKSEPGKNTRDSAFDEDEIIELRDVVESQDAEEVIELNDPVEDDGVIELTDTVAASESDDEIIELVDSVNEDEVIELTDTIEMPAPEEEIIELEDSLEPGESGDEVIELADALEDSYEDASDASNEEELIELTDISGDEAPLDEEPIDLMDTLESEPAVIEEEFGAIEDNEETEKTLDLLDTLESDQISMLGGDHVPDKQYQEPEVPDGTDADKETPVDIYDYEEVEKSTLPEEDLLELNDIAGVIQAGEEKLALAQKAAEGEG